MNKLITSRQAILLVVCTQLSTKFQRMPAILAKVCGRDAWLIVLIWLAVDILLLMLTIKICELCKGRTIYKVIEETAGKFVAKAVSLMFILYFLMKALIASKGTHEFFASNLFDKLPWQYFSIILLFMFILMVGKGVRVIGRNAELYVYLVMLGLIGSVCLGLTVTDFSKILPIMDNNVFKVFYESSKHNIYFGDFLILFMFVGNVKENKNYKRNLILTYLIIGLILVLFNMVFYGIYENMAQGQSHGLADTIQFTLIGLGIGRIDWFLVLFTFLYTIISTALFLWVIVYNFTLIFNVKYNYLLVTILLLVVYILEVYIFSNVQTMLEFSTDYFTYFGIFVHIVLPFILLIIVAVNRRKQKGAIA